MSGQLDSAQRRPALNTLEVQANHVHHALTKKSIAALAVRALLLQYYS